MLRIVFNMSPSRLWESDWIAYLFREIPHQVVVNRAGEFFDDAIFVYPWYYRDFFRPYIVEMIRRGLRFGLIHLSDELRTPSILPEDADFYRQSRLVLRNYLRADMPPHVYTFPLGWNSGLAKQGAPERTARERRHTWASVMGRTDENREQLLRDFLPIAGGFPYRAHIDGPLLDPVQMGEVYRDAIFVPCARGIWAIDSFRVTEAFESGSIPIVERDPYWANLHGGGFPAPQVTSWAEAADLVRRALQDPPALEARRRACADWWQGRKADVRQRIGELVRERFPEAFAKGT